MHVNKVSNQNFSGIKYRNFRDRIDISNKLADRYKTFSNKWWQIQDKIIPVVDSERVLVEITSKGDVLVKDGTSVFIAKGETKIDKFLSAIRKARAIIRKQNPEELKVKVPFKKQYEKIAAKTQAEVEKFERELRQPLDNRVINV